MPHEALERDTPKSGTRLPVVSSFSRPFRLASKLVVTVGRRACLTLGASAYLVG